MSDGEQFPLSPERRPFFGPADYLKAALARLSAATETQGFDVREVTLFFYEDEREVRLKVELRIAAELLDHAPTLDRESAGAARHEPSTEHEPT